MIIVNDNKAFFLLIIKIRIIFFPRETFDTGDHMSDKLVLDAEIPKQTARPIFWFLGFVGILFVGAIVYGIV